MAKSAGGAPRLADLTEAGYHPAAFRLFLLGGHYRSQLDFTTAAIDAAQATLRRLARPGPAAPPAAGRSKPFGKPRAETLQAAIEPADDPPPRAGWRCAEPRRQDRAWATWTLIGRRPSPPTSTTPRLLAALQDALRDPEITPDGLRTVIAAADALLGLGLATLDPADLGPADRRTGPRPRRPERRGSSHHRAARRRPRPGPPGTRLGPRRRDPRRARRPRRPAHRHPRRPRLAPPLAAAPSKRPKCAYPQAGPAPDHAGNQ